MRLTLRSYCHIGHLGIHVFNHLFAILLDDSIEVKIEGLLGRQIARQSLQRSTPHSRNHINDKDEVDDNQNQTEHAQLLDFLFALEADFSEEVKSEQGEAHNPNAEINLAVEQVPVVGLVGYAEEFEAQRDFDEAQHDLHGGEPATTLGQALEQIREEGKQGKRQRKGHCEGKHRHNGSPKLARSRFDEHRAHDGTCAGKRHQNQGQSHKENAA